MTKDEQNIIPRNPCSVRFELNSLSKTLSDVSAIPVIRKSKIGKMEFFRSIFFEELIFGTIKYSAMNTKIIPKYFGDSKDSL
ncbi:MAG: hypothetical protein BalsKO_12540 [Balneolaceae bacterium]